MNTIAPFLNAFENWKLAGGERIQVTVLYRYIPIGEQCPQCDAVIRVAVATAKGGLPVFRLECGFCDWLTEALPDSGVE